VAISHIQSALKDQSQNSLEFDGKFFHIQCADHIINLIFKDGPEIISEGIGKIQESVQFVKGTPSCKQAFHNAIKLTKIKKQALPLVDVPTQ
jgi:hypothetical protein